jgi:hypothetical protein
MPSIVLGSGFGQVFPNDLPADIGEDFIDVGRFSRARLVVRNVAPTLRQLKRLRSGHCAIFLQVGFVPDEDDGERGIVFGADDLLAELDEFAEGGGRGDAEDEKEALSQSHVHVSVGGLVSTMRRASRRIQYLMAAE